jgi:hypothetical protein
MHDSDIGGDYLRKKSVVNGRVLDMIPIHLESGGSIAFA